MVNSAQFSLDGKSVVTASGGMPGSKDCTARLWQVALDISREGLLKRTGALTNYRVCEDSLEVVAVLPFPEPESVWAPEALCKKDASQ